MISGLKPYPKMKDSGEPWVGRLPAHWETHRAKTLLRERVQKGLPSEPLLAATQTKGVVKKEAYENRTVLALKDLHLLKLVEVGDFVISLRSFQGGIEYSRERGIISPAYTVLYPADPCNHGYFAWLFKSRPFVENLSLYVTGIRQGQNIDYEKLGRSGLPTPPPQEQEAIVRFLDYVDRRIRRYIAAKQKLINLLEEQKQAIIHRAVTHGLDPNVRLKSAGVGWLGDIPAHWRVQRLGRLARVFNGTTPSRMETTYWLNGVIPWLSSGKVNDYVIETPSELVTERALQECSISIVPKGAVIVGLVGQGKTRGKSAILGMDACINQNLAAIIPLPGLRGDYLHQFMTAFYLRLREFGRGGNQEALNCEIVANFPVCIPPEEEQRGICDYLRVTLAGGLGRERLVEHEISLLHEYRKRLIADVVTGKVDVREAAASLPDEGDEPEPFEEPMALGDTDGSVDAELADELEVAES